jgi:hypothetical protein
MSSSLDDLEPYEVFQHELDEYMKEYFDFIFNTHGIRNEKLMKSFD